MTIRHKIAIFGLAAGLAVLTIVAIAADGTFAVLAARGSIALQQRELLVQALLLMLLIVVPVFALTGYIAWKYRAGNTKAEYKPDWDRNHKLEAIWWGFPTALILVLSVIIWQSSHSLDPFRPIASNKDTLTIQVVALQWKWLFIYPEQNLATVNYLKLPEDTPVKFEITADAPMNSFWIPQLGGQVYAMSGMKTDLHLLANEPGAYQGSSANLSGEGFADMKFIASAVTEREFRTWVRGIKKQTNRLDLPTYNELAAPSRQKVLASYASAEDNLQNTIINKYAAHGYHNPYSKQNQHEQHEPAGHSR